MASKDAKRGHLGLLFSANSRETCSIKQKIGITCSCAGIRGLDQRFPRQSHSSFRENTEMRAFVTYVISRPKSNMGP